MPRSAPNVFDRATRRLSLVGRLAETWFHRPSSPTRVVLDITRRCNLRCSMCRTWERRDHHEMSASRLGQLVGELPKLTWLDVTGGEPFVRPDVAAVFDEIIDNGPALKMLHFQTNGWSTERIVEVTASVAKRVALRCDLLVTVSLDGPPSVHDSIRGRIGSAKRALRTARALRRLPNVEVHIGTTVTRSNADALGDLDALLHRELPGFDRRRWHWNWVQESQHFFGNGGLEITEPVAPSRHLASHIQARGRPRSMVELMEAAYLVNLRAFQEGTPRSIGCQALRSTAFVSPEGDVYPCHIYDRPLGNVRDRSFATIWNSAATASARRDVEALRCGGCFSACEAYPAMAGAPLATARATARALLGSWT